MTAGRRDRQSGAHLAVVSGFVLRLARESAGPPCSRERLAHDLGIAPDTVAGWETGRRALHAIRIDQAIALRYALLGVGADAALIRLLDTAIEADLLIEYSIRTGDSWEPGQPHPLAARVLRRDVVDLIAWPVSARTPAGLPKPRTGRGPTPAHPELTADDRARFFNHLRRVVDHARDERHALVRRQALYLLSFDQRPDASAFLTLHRGRLPHGLDGWSGAWPAARSLAASMTRQGDRVLLLDFITHGLADERSQIANLNYWAYWVGEGTGIQRDDTFMPEALGPWHGDVLLRHLIERLDERLGYVDLNIHTLWALIAARPTLLAADRTVSDQLRSRVETLLDTRTVSTQAVRELDAIRYALRLQR